MKGGKPLKGPCGVSTRPAPRPQRCSFSSEMQAMRLTRQMDVVFLPWYQHIPEGRRETYPQANSSPKTRPALPQRPPALPTDSSAPHPPASPSATPSPGLETSLRGRKTPQPPAVAFPCRNPSSMTMTETMRTSKTSVPDLHLHGYRLYIHDVHLHPAAPGKLACIP